MSGFDKKWLDKYCERTGIENPLGDSSLKAYSPDIKKPISKPLKYRTTESGEQQAVIVWCDIAQGQHPELRLLHHIPNGGLRNPVVAGQLKAEGVKPGVPDLMLPIARGGYFGLYIEMKVGDNTPTDDQKRWLYDLAQQGYKTIVCYSSIAAIEVLEDYLKLPLTKPIGAESELSAL